MIKRERDDKKMIENMNSSKQLQNKKRMKSINQIEKEYIKRS